jgi:hypothetical protein
MPAKYRLITFFILFSAPQLIALSQPNRVNIGDRPRNKDNFDKPGYYEMVAYLDKSEISPGDSFNVNIYFSGYGEIRLSKVFFSVSKNIYKNNECYGMGGLTIYGKASDSTYTWGANVQKLKIMNAGVIPLEGVSNTHSPEWGEPTNYVDYGEEPGSIAILTEMTLLHNPPYSLHLKTLDDAEPGNYTITLVYTYFNGQEWKGNKQVLALKVNNIIERNPGWAWAIGILAVLLAFIAIVPLLTELGKRVTRRVFKRRRLVIPGSVPAPVIPTKKDRPNMSKKKR